ncbi:MAG TPA: acyltransferase [Granulicella sp.]
MFTVKSASAEQLPRHWNSLDGIRGLAILMVVFTHAFHSNYETGGMLVRPIGQLFDYCRFGVDLFFVLSGFLITGILVDTLGDEGYFRKFYMRRTLRIFPLYYGVLLVLFLLTPRLHLHWQGMGWLLPFYLQNLSPGTIRNFFPSPSIGLYHFWSLAVEEQFYLVWPAIVLLVRRRDRLLRVALIGSAAALALRLMLVSAGVSEQLVRVTTVCRADTLLLGGALAFLYRSRSWERVQRAAPWGVFAVAAILLAIIPAEPRLAVLHPRLWPFWQDGLHYSVLAVGFACMIAWALRAGSLCERVFLTGWLRFLGKYSYGLYVLHVLVLTQLEQPLRATIGAATHSKLLGVIGSAVILISLSIALAYACFHLYEKPFLGLKRYFAYGPKRQPERLPERESVLGGHLSGPLEGINLVNS